MSHFLNSNQAVSVILVITLSFRDVKILVTLGNEP
jgi:hypothetical protein